MAKAVDFAHAATIVNRVDLTEKAAAAAKKPDLPKTVPPETKVKLVMPQAQRKDRPPLIRTNKPGSATAPSSAASQSTPDGESKDQTDHACAAAGPASQKEEKFEMPIPPPPEIVDLTATSRLPSPPLASTEAAAASSAYDDSNRFPRSKRDRERQNDEDRDDEKSKPPGVELVRGKVYKHRLLGKVEYLNRKRLCFGTEMMCSVKMVGTYIYETHLVHRRDLEPLKRPPASDTCDRRRCSRSQ